MDKEIFKELKKIPNDYVQAAVPKEFFKSIFYMFAGKPDSKIKLINRKVIIEPEDIHDLNSKILDKLSLHLIEEGMTTAVIKFDDKKIIEFSTWGEFQNFDYKIPSVTQEISIRWDFVIKIPEYKLPQRHTLVVRLSTLPRVQDVFKMIISQESEDEIDIETKIGLCVARVDFISHRLADELIEVVKEWNMGLKQPDAACGWFSKIEKFDKWIARIVHNSITLIMIIFFIVLLNSLIPSSSNPISTRDLLVCAKWLFASFVGIYIVNRIGIYLAKTCYEAINEYGVFMPFFLTNGDKNLAQKINNKNKKKVKTFIFNALIAFLINIIAGITIWNLLK